MQKDSKDPYLPNLMKIRLLMTGFIYQFLFKRKLSFKQWISLLVLTGGCMIQKLNPDVISTNSKTDETEYVFMDGNSLFSSSLVLIMIQVIYSKYCMLKIQVNFCQKLLFLHLLTHNMTTDCSWNYHENYKVCPCSALLVFVAIP